MTPLKKIVPFGSHKTRVDPIFVDEVPMNIREMIITSLQSSTHSWPAEVAPPIIAAIDVSASEVSEEIITATTQAQHLHDLLTKTIKAQPKDGRSQPVWIFTNSSHTHAFWVNLHQHHYRQGFQVVPISTDLRPSALNHGFKPVVDMLCHTQASRFLAGDGISISLPTEEVKAPSPAKDHATLIVGGSGGLGQAAATELANQMKANKIETRPIFVTYYNRQTEAEQFARTLTETTGVQVTPLNLDVANAHSHGDFARQLGTQLSCSQRIDQVLLASGAGSSTIADQSGISNTSSSVEKAARFMAVNATGPASLLQNLAKHDVLEKGGDGTAVVAVSSVGARDVNFAEFNVADGASKDAFTSLMLTLSAPLAAEGIYVHVGKPGGLDTPMLKASFLNWFKDEFGDKALQRLYDQGWVSRVEDYAAFVAARLNPSLAKLIACQEISTHCALHRRTLPYGTDIDPPRN